LPTTLKHNSYRRSSAFIGGSVARHGAPPHRVRQRHEAIPALGRAKAGETLVFHSYMWEHGAKLESNGEKRLFMIHRYRTAIPMGHSPGWPLGFHRFGRPVVGHRGQGDAPGRKPQGIRRQPERERASWPILRCGGKTRTGSRPIPSKKIVDATCIGGRRAWQAAPSAKVALHLHAAAVCGDCDL